ncbi:hypothetical protein P8452_66736 [Trifolium repens]|nr:hypothetical protein P8452_66736 [Trifolium repens]
MYQCLCMDNVFPAFSRDVAVHLSSLRFWLTGHHFDRSICNWFGSGTTSFLNLIPSSLIVLECIGFFWKLYKFSVI